MSAKRARQGSTAVKIYVACALTHVPRNQFDRYVAFIHRLVTELQSETENQVTYALVHSDPQLATKPFEERARLCYQWDRELVESADLIIAEASFPSTGMGIELQIAENRGTPIIICFKKSDERRVQHVDYENPDCSKHSLQIGEGFVSLMVLGLPTVSDVIGYATDEEGIACLLAAVRRLEKNRPITVASN
jgi:hypothetical protein